jgi:hypothetical protein
MFKNFTPEAAANVTTPAYLRRVRLNGNRLGLGIGYIDKDQLIWVNVTEEYMAHLYKALTLCDLDLTGVVDAETLEAAIKDKPVAEPPVKHDETFGESVDLFAWIKQLEKKASTNLPF